MFLLLPSLENNICIITNKQITGKIQDLLRHFSKTINKHLQEPTPLSASATSTFELTYYMDFGYYHRKPYLLLPPWVTDITPVNLTLLPPWASGITTVSLTYYYPPWRQVLPPSALQTTPLRLQVLPPSAIQPVQTTVHPNILYS